MDNAEQSTKPNTVSQELEDLFELYYFAYLNHLGENYNCDGVPRDELPESEVESMIAGIKTMLGAIG